MVINGQVPVVLISGQSLAIVDCIYNWTTCTEEDIGITTVVVSGYIGTDNRLRTFKLDFKNDQATEIITGQSDAPEFMTKNFYIPKEEKNNVAT